jgi:Protein of unknown function (DUF2934)
MKTPPQVPTPIRPTTESTGDLQEQIRLRAYQLYNQRGREDGHDVSDWLQAESEVTQQQAQPIAA